MIKMIQQPVKKEKGRKIDSLTETQSRIFEESMRRNSELMKELANM